MTVMKSALFGTALIVAGSSAALAGNPTAAPAEPVITPPATPVMTTGDWTGGYVGGSLGYGNWDLGAATGDGANLGAFAGYDYDFGSYVLGGEVQYLGNDVTIGGTSLDGVTRVKARAGYDAGPVLLYGVGGYGHAQTGAGDTDGYVAGIGMDYQLNNGVTLGAEYLYNDFGTVGGSDLSGNTIEARASWRF
ncbi:outer membrane protein [Pseudooceanicola sp.]|uniref:outer membrane protein n=1 Tax=Pseudooceanicola sp. TaxID=1914328 RepID=UPI0035C70826